jgi:hypothetical protein
MTVGVPIRPLGAAIVAGLVAAAFLAGGAARAAQSPRSLTVYSVATKEQFLNHSDDRPRGLGNNPFGNFKDTTGPSGKETSGNGPFAGDRSIFTFALFGSNSTRKPIGSALFVCEYMFDQNAFCSTSYVLPRGTLLGTGYFNFNAATFDVSVTGGTGKYAGARGLLHADKTVHKLQRLTVKFE